jgi:transposase-like protein
MDARTEEIRREAESHRQGPGGSGKPYPEELREKAVRYMRQRLKAGVSLQSLAQALCISEPTLRAWCKAAPSSKLCPVVVKAEEDPRNPVDPEGGEMTLVSPGGYRLVGLDLKSAVFALKVLG